jgi:hypothetical protein
VNAPARSSVRRARTVAADLLDRLLRRIEPAHRIPAPYPIHVRRTGIGAEVAVDSLAAALLLGLMTEVAEDPTGLADEAAYLVQTNGPERDRLMEDLIYRLGGATVRLGATDARRLADRLNTAAGPIVLPRQQDRRAA